MAFEDWFANLPIAALLHSVVSRQGCDRMAVTPMKILGVAVLNQSSELIARALFGQSNFNERWLTNLRYVIDRRYSKVTTTVIRVTANAARLTMSTTAPEMRAIPATQSNGLSPG